jgi:hypothetical protein
MWDWNFHQHNNAKTDVFLSSRMDAKAQLTGPAASNLPRVMFDLAVSASVVSAAILVPGCNP